jgi:hypothetical protein
MKVTVLNCLIALCFGLIFTNTSAHADDATTMKPTNQIFLLHYDPEALDDTLKIDFCAIKNPNVDGENMKVLAHLPDADLFCTHFAGYDQPITEDTFRERDEELAQYFHEKRFGAKKSWQDKDTEYWQMPEVLAHVTDLRLVFMTHTLTHTDRSALMIYLNGETLNVATAYYDNKPTHFVPFQAYRSILSAYLSSDTADFAAKYPWACKGILYCR